MERRKWNGSDRLFFLCILGLAIAVAASGISLLQQSRAADQIFQGVISLGKISYNKEFLKEAEKIPGIVSVTPVRRVPVRLKAEGYTMEAEVIGVDLSELSMTGTKAAEIRQGSNPVFFLGRKSLSGMTDHNGHKISEKMQKKLLENFEKINWQYQLTGGDNEAKSGQASEASGSADAETLVSEETDSDSNTQAGSAASGSWLPCTVGAVLTKPDEEIYISSDQAENLLGESNAFAENKDISEILLTVRGRDHYRKALSMFEKAE